MIVYLYGKDSYRRGRKLREIKSAYKEKYPAADFLEKDFEEEKDVLERIREFLVQPSMFTDSKLLIVKESGRLPERERKGWLKALKSQLDAPKTFLLISDSEEPLKDFKFLLTAPVRQQFFPALKGRDLEIFLGKEAEKLGLKFEPDAWRFFISYVNDGEETAWLGIRELEKISLASFKKPMRMVDLISLIKCEKKDAVYAVAQSISASRDYKSRLILLEKLFLQQKEPAYIFNSLAFGLRGPDLIRLADWDEKIKSGKSDYEEALTDFVL